MCHLEWINVIKTPCLPFYQRLCSRKTKEEDGEMGQNEGEKGKGKERKVHDLYTSTNKCEGNKEKNADGIIYQLKIRLSMDHGYGEEQ